MCLRKSRKICVRGSPERSPKICALYLGGGASENVPAQILRIFPTRLELFSKTKLHKQINSQALQPPTSFAQNFGGVTVGDAEHIK